MKVHSTRLMGLILIERKRFGDHRGFLRKPTAAGHIPRSA